VVAPFVRPLYPPSSPKKSEGGLDVGAIKRGLSRMGFWLWQEFDDEYNQRFATEAVAEFRKSVGLSKSLVYDAATHARLAAAKVPKDLPHTGESAFDQTAVNLLEQAKAALTPPQQKVAVDLLAYCGLWDGPYVWGGGHDGTPLNDSPHVGADCSGSTSDVLAKFNLLGSSEQHVSGWFKTWGAGGRGRFITVHAADDHVWIEFTIPGKPWARFDTSPHGCGSFGPRVRKCQRDAVRFISRHPVGGY